MKNDIIRHLITQCGIEEQARERHTVFKMSVIHL